MTIGLLRFPFLVQKVIFEEIDLLSALTIAMLSKKSHATVRTCLRHHNYHLRYDEDYSIRLERKFGKKDGHALVLFLIDQDRPLFSCQLWRIGSQEVFTKSMSTESNGSISTRTSVCCDNKLDFATETLQYLSRLLPKLSLTLKLKARSVETFRKTMKSVESAEEINEISVVEHVWDRDPVSQNEFVKVVLDESQRAKNLSVHFLPSNNFEYPTSVPFKFDYVSMISTSWISRDHFIKLFLSCKKVHLKWKNFEDEDLAAIFKAWTEGSPLEVLQFLGTQNFYLGKILDFLKQLPGAAPVKNAIISTGIFTRPSIITFGEGKCYLIQQSNGQKTALVYTVYQSIMLSTKFQIGKEVDEMVARIEAEEERLRRHPVDENMEAEAE
ncbi:hypothetical protein CAEBREN_04621 [Caenorhabditis brenneri]|uniref:F-box domain-containing protein n=1 Tax=Caenorhabditis brenneri TaxID=135651 RepID=G0NCR3_CAEBE|nr:hypothetical protein CAEBREN_04621 [Caenorhabditis brenneri]